MKGAFGMVQAALAAAALMASLSLVAWRQSRALDSLAELDAVRRERAQAAAEVADLHRRIHHLESRARVVPAARRQLGMETPDVSRIVYLTRERR